MSNKNAFLLFISFSVIALNTQSPVFADWSMDEFGNLVYGSSQVLGEGDKMEVSITPRPRKELRPVPTRPIKIIDNGGTVMETNREKKLMPENMEIKNEEVKKINLNPAPDNQIKLNVETNDEKKLEHRQDKFEIKQTNTTLKITNSENKGELEIEKNGVKATTKLSLTVDPQTKQLTVATPGGTKTLTITPDAAENTMKNLKVISSVKVNNQVKIANENNQIVYNIKSTKKEKLLGVISVNVEKEAKMSAETGEYLGTKQSNLSKIIDALSF